MQLPGLVMETLVVNSVPVGMKGANTGVNVLTATKGNRVVSIDGKR